MLRGPFEWSVAGAMAVVVALIAGWYTVEGLQRSGTESSAVREVLGSVKQLPQSPDPPATAPDLTPQPRPQRPAPTRRSWFRFVGARGDSWLQIRAGSPNARVLYDGTLAEGTAVRFRTHTLWVRFGSTNVNLSVAGERVRLPSMGTFDAFVTRAGLRRDPVFHPDPVQATAAQSP